MSVRDVTRRVLLGAAIGSAIVTGLLLRRRRASATLSTTPNYPDHDPRLMEQRLEEVQRRGGLGIFEYDLTTERIWWSDEMSRILGLEPSSVEPSFDRFLALVHPEDRSTVVARRNAWRTSDPPLTAEYRIIRPDGVIRRVLRTASAIRNAEGRTVRLLGTVQDVTDRYQERQQRIASEERYRLLFEKNPVPLWLFDEESLRFLDVNEAAIRHYGYSREEFLRMSILDIRPAEDVPRLMQSRATPAGGYRVAGEWRHLRSDGTIIDVDIVRHQFVLDGRLVQLVMTTDITERRRAENELRESRAELERFSERLQSAIEEERARISREIHDELGQSLTGLRMHAAILDSRLGDRADLVTETAAMTAIIDETVRTVRRIATELRPGVLDAFGLVAATEWAVHDFTTRSGVHADFVNHLNVEPELGGERDTHVFRVVQEALTNVARHSEAGSVAIELAEGPDELIVRVQDDGRGFDTAPSTAHASLGLLGMRERARMLGGTLELESERGRGTRITLHVPRQPRVEADDPLPHR